MNQTTSQSELPDLMARLSAFQQDSIEMLMKSMDDFIGGKNPMNPLNAANMKGNPMASAFSDYLDVIQKSVKGMIDMSEAVMPDLTRPDKAPFNTFIESFPGIPAQVMKKIFAIPPVGLTRPHQEKINKALDKWAVFNTAAMEFMMTTFVPLEEATRMTLKEIMKQSESMRTPEDAQKIYEKWLKIMETEYQALFKTDRYKHVIAKIFSAMAEFRAATRELILDLMHLTGLPFGREVDELGKEMFELKKKVKVLEAQIRKMEESTVH